MQVLIIGAGLGGLVCAIACRRAGIEVTVLEQSAEISEVGAGIQIPPNASRVMRNIGLLSQVQSEAIRVQWIDILRYKNGERLIRRPLSDDHIKTLGGEWLVIHRADYHNILLQEAKRLGANILLSSRVVDVNVRQTKAMLGNKTFAPDVIIGADGLWSITRDSLLDKPAPPYETGDLAYRAIVSRDTLLGLNDPRVRTLCDAPGVTIWVGPRCHCVFYPIKKRTVFNLVLLRPDNMPRSSRKAEGSLQEMQETFEGWDPVLTKIISGIPSVLKWKLMHQDEIEQWTKYCTTILGDACHPTLPYQAQGAAMAVEDGALIGYLLGEYEKVKYTPHLDKRSLQSLLKLYEKMRKSRTTVNVVGAVNNRHFYHMEDGVEQTERDQSMKMHNWQYKSSKYSWLDVHYQQELLGYDVLWHGKQAFLTWWAEEYGGKGYI